MGFKVNFVKCYIFFKYFMDFIMYLKKCSFEVNNKIGIENMFFLNWFYNICC